MNNKLINQYCNKILKDALGINDEEYTKNIKNKDKNTIIKTEEIYTSKVRLDENKVVTGTYTFLNTNGTGTVKQILFKGNSTNFKIFILLDSRVLYNHYYQFFEDNSNHLEDITAYVDGTEYIVSISDLQFRKNLFIRVISDSSTTFSIINIKYKIREEVLP